jgi:multidrug efflux pump subunit AcrB
VFTPYLGVKLLPNIAKREGGHEAIYDTPRYNQFRRFLGLVIRRKWLVAGSVVGAFVVAVLGVGGQATVLSDVRSTGGAGRSADAVWDVHRADECRQRQGRGVAGQAAGSQVVTAYIGQGAPRFFLAMSPSCRIPRSRRSSS